MNNMYEREYTAEMNPPWQNWRNKSLGAASVRKIAYDLIRDKIISLEFKPGEALNDKRLAEELQMSRTPVREALIILANNDLVIFKPQSGTFVSPIDTQQMELEQFARYVMEKEIIGLLSTRMGEDILRQYSENLAAFRAQSLRVQGGVTELDRGRRLLETDNAFHAIAFQALGRMADFAHMLHGQNQMLRMRMLSLLGDGNVTLAEEHEQIVSALARGDAATAQSWLHLHLHRYRDNLTELKEKFPRYFELG